MVRTKAPLVSLDAAGQIAGVMIHQTWKGRTYARKLTIPNNPNTAAQVGVRVMMSYLTKHWATLGPTTRDTWNELADQQMITPMDANVQDGLRRWTTGKYPTERYPAGELLAAMGASMPTPVQQGRGALITYANTPLNNGIGTILFRSTSPGFTPGPGNAITVQEYNGEAWRTYLDTPLDPGTYYYRTYNFSIDGKVRIYASERNITIV